MDKPGTTEHRTRGTRILGLRALFVAAALVALLGRTLPRALPQVKTGIGKGISRLNRH
jgi:hypothetical protein